MFSSLALSARIGVCRSVEKMDTEQGEVAQQNVPSISVFYCQHSI